MSCMEAGRWNFNRRTSRRARRCSGQVAGGAEGERRGKPGCGRKLPQRPGGAVWREVSYSLRETRRRRQLRTTGKGARRSPTRSTRSSSAFSRWTGRSAPFSSARGILGLEIAGRGGPVKRCLPKIIRSFAFEVLNDEDLGSVPEDVAASWWAWACRRPPVRGAPRPGRAMTSGSTRARYVSSGLYWNHSLATCRAFPGRDPGPLPGRAPARARRPAQPQPEALGAERQATGCARMIMMAPVAIPPRRPHLPASERQASAPQPRRRQSARDRPGNCSPPLGGLFLSPADRYRRGSAGIRGSQKEPARRTVPPPPSAGCSSTPVSRVSAATCVPRKTLDASRSGTSFATRLFLPARPGCRIPHLPSSGSHALADQVPDSVTDIDRPAAGADPPRGHDAPLLLVDLSNGEFSTPAVGSSVRRLAMPQRDR